MDHTGVCGHVELPRTGSSGFGELIVVLAFRSISWPPPEADGGRPLGPSVAARTFLIPALVSLFGRGRTPRRAAPRHSGELIPPWIYSAKPSTGYASRDGGLERTTKSRSHHRPRPCPSGLISTLTIGTKATSPVDRIREPALIALGGQRQVAHDEMAVGFKRPMAGPPGSCRACLHRSPIGRGRAERDWTNVRFPPTRPRIGVVPPRVPPRSKRRDSCCGDGVAAICNVTRRLCADPVAMRYIGNGEVLDRAQSWREIAMHLGDWMLRGYGQWALERREDGVWLGQAGLWNPPGWPGLEVGLGRLARQAWGEGYATEAGRAAIEWAWTTLDAEELISVIQPGNAASIRVAERLGMQRLRTSVLKGQDVVILGLHRPPSVTRS